MTYSTITVRQDGAVDWLTLNRPDRLNGLTAPSDYWAAILGDNGPGLLR